jgi:hypothetical protein
VQKSEVIAKNIRAVIAIVGARNEQPTETIIDCRIFQSTLESRARVATTLPNDGRLTRFTLQLNCLDLCTSIYDGS